MTHYGHGEVHSASVRPTTLSVLSPLRGRVGVALGEALRSGYDLHALRADVLAGIVVGVVALPLSMALAIASGVPPQYGLYTAIVAGGVIAVLGGSRVQVSGPTAAFVALLAPVSARFGPGGLLLASAMAGVLLVGMGATRMGRFVEFIPYPVTAGFTAGVAVVIATLQLRDFLGLTVPEMPDVFADRIGALLAALPSTRPADVMVGVGTLAILLLWPRVSRKVPAPLVALAAAAAAAHALAAWDPGFHVATIQSRFSYVVDGVRHAGIPPLPPLPVLPWRLGGPDGAPLVLSLELVRALLPSAVAITLLGAIESLLSAVVADGMTGHRHDPDAELIAQGAGNLVAPFFGGFAATGALARTATNVRAGARSPLAAVVHSVVVLLSVLVLAPVLGHLPMAALAALLLVVAWNMAEGEHFLRLMRVAPRADVLVLLTCFGLTVVFDMVVSVIVGVMLASLLFMRRMAEVSGVTRVSRHAPRAGRAVAPRGRPVPDRWAAVLRGRPEGAGQLARGGPPGRDGGRPGRAGGAGPGRHRPHEPGVVRDPAQRRRDQGRGGGHPAAAPAHPGPGGLAQPQGPAADLPVVRRRHRPRPGRRRGAHRRPSGPRSWIRGECPRESRTGA